MQSSLNFGLASPWEVNILRLVGPGLSPVRPNDKLLIYGIVIYRDIIDKKRKVTFGYQIVRGAQDYTLERLPEHAYNENT